MTILEAIGEAALLEQWAEECTEQAQAALKVARILRKENPTPVTLAKARKNLIEETADASLCRDEWVYSQQDKDDIIEEMISIKKAKRERWYSRLGETNAV